MAVIRKGQETPLHPPCQGDKGLRQANQKPRVEYWHELLAYIDAAYRKKFGRHYPWNNLARRNLWNLARGHSAWGVMALWDLYLAGESWWSQRTGRSVYGMIRDAGRLIDDARCKHLAVKHEENLAKQRFGQFSTAKDILDRIGFRWNPTLRPQGCERKQRGRLDFCSSAQNPMQVPSGEAAAWFDTSWALLAAATVSDSSRTAAW